MITENYIKKFNWEKQGLLFDPNISGYSHGSHPTIVHVRRDFFIVAFTCRDKYQRSQIFLSQAEISNGIIS